jgi:mono/diheme cytochrome c family protein
MIDLIRRTIRDVFAGLRIPVAILSAAAISFSAHGADADTKAKMELGRNIFTKLAEPPCGVCHTLKDAGTSGEIGAKLEEIKPDANRVAAAVREGVGIMPSYAGKLTDQQVQAVAYYVSRVVNGTK